MKKMSQILIATLYTSKYGTGNGNPVPEIPHFIDCYLQFFKKQKLQLPFLTSDVKVPFEESV